MWQAGAAEVKNRIELYCRSSQFTELGRQHTQQETTKIKQEVSNQAHERAQREQLNLKMGTKFHTFKWKQTDLRSLQSLRNTVSESGPRQCDLTRF